MRKYRVIHKSLRDLRPLLYSSRDGHAEGEHVNRGTDTQNFCPTLQVLDMSTLGDAACQSCNQVPATHLQRVWQDRNFECLSLCWHAPLRRDHLGYCTAEVRNPEGTYELPCIVRVSFHQYALIFNWFRNPCGPMIVILFCRTLDFPVWSPTRKKIYIYYVFSYSVSFVWIKYSARILLHASKNILIIQYLDCIHNPFAPQGHFKYKKKYIFQIRCARIHFTKTNLSSRNIASSGCTLELNFTLVCDENFTVMCTFTERHSWVVYTPALYTGNRRISWLNSRPGCHLFWFRLPFDTFISSKSMPKQTLWLPPTFISLQAYTLTYSNIQHCVTQERYERRDRLHWGASSWFTSVYQSKWASRAWYSDQTTGLMIGVLYQFPVGAEVSVFLYRVQRLRCRPSSHPTGGNRTTLPRLKFFFKLNDIPALNYSNT